MDIGRKLLSEIVTHKSYARHLDHENRRENWEEIIDRNKAMHIKRFPFLKDEIETVYKEYVLPKIVLPSMRSLQFAGPPIELNPARMYNCAYLPINSWEAFHEIMFLLLGGSGVGYSVQRHHIAQLPPVVKPLKKRKYVISDSIQGWADSVRVLVKSYFTGSPLPLFDFSDIRPKGSLLKTSGGRAPGPQPLMDALYNINSILASKNDGDKISSLEANDIACFLADAVLAGGIRRAALISLFSFDDEDMITSKYGNWWELNPQRARANNSAIAPRSSVTKEAFFDYMKRVELAGSGDPGIVWTNDKSLDYGCNPCGEISLAPYQFCNLNEINSSLIESQEDLNNFAKAAAFIGTLQASYTDFYYLREVWKKTTDKDALLGVSLTGICNGKVDSFDLKQAAKHVLAENERVSKLIGTNPASRATTIKPSGNSAAVLGTSSGIHAEHDHYYTRRMRINKKEPMYNYLSQTFPSFMEDDILKPTIEGVFSLPLKSDPEAIIRSEESLEDMLERVKKFNIEWVKEGHRAGPNNNNVSATVNVKSDEWDYLSEWMWNNKKYYNGLAVLPFYAQTHPQMPFEAISEEVYNDLVNKLQKDCELNSYSIDYVLEAEDGTNLTGEAACAGGLCEIV